MLTCPVCEEGTLENFVEKNDIGKGLIVDCHYSVCNVCECDQASSEQLTMNQYLAREARKGLVDTGI